MIAAAIPMWGAAIFWAICGYVAISNAFKAGYIAKTSNDLDGSAVLQFLFAPFAMMASSGCAYLAIKMVG